MRGGETAVVALMVENKTFIANAGDSIAMVVQADKNIVIPRRHNVTAGHRVGGEGNTWFRIKTIDDVTYKVIYTPPKALAATYLRVAIKNESAEWHGLSGLQTTKGLGDWFYANFGSVLNVLLLIIDHPRLEEVFINV